MNRHSFNLKSIASLSSVLCIIGVLFLSAEFTQAATSCETFFSKSESREVSFVPEKSSFDERLLRMFSSFKLTAENQFGLTTRIENAEVRNFVLATLRDPVNGPGKIKVLEELGFKFDLKSGAVSQSVDWYDFAVNYRKAMERRGLRPGEYLRPALVYSKRIEGGRRLHKIVDPLRDPLPSTEDGWEANFDHVGVGYRDVLEAFIDGKFTLSPGLHDVDHFVGFMQAPEFARAVAKAASALPKNQKFPGSFGRRYLWLMEYMTYPDPTQKSSILKFLKNERRIVGNVSRRELRESLDTYSEKQLLSYAQRLASKYSTFLVDISGGSSGTWEKLRYLGSNRALFGANGEGLFGLWHGSFAEIVKLHALYFSEGPWILSQGTDPMYNDMNNLNFSLFETGIRGALAELRRTEGNESVADLSSVDRGQAMNMLKDFISLAEYSLNRAAHDLDIYTFASEMLDPNLKPDAATANFLREIFPGFRNRQSYLPKP